MNMEFIITNEIKAVDREAIFEGLLEYNLSKIEDKNPKDLGIYWLNHKFCGMTDF